MKKKTKIILAVCIIAGIIAIGLLVRGIISNNGSNDAGATGDDSAMKVETPVAELSLDTNLDSVSIDKDDSEEANKESFYLDFKGEKILLYTFTFGEKGEGYLVGSAPDKKGNKVNIWLDINPIEKKDGWTDDEFNEINSIQGNVNEILDQIQSLKGFEGK